MNTPATKPERNYGIDLLRILAMFMVALLHVLGQGGILSAYGKDGSFLKYETVWLLEIAAYGAVNCYALISGYVGIKARHKLSSLISLTLQTTFYTVLITLLFKLFRPETVSVLDIVKAFFPFGFKHYWYFSAYFCLFFFLPLLNKLLLSLSQVQLKRMIGLLVLVFSLLPTLFMRDLFLVNGGYSALWLAILYLIGGALRLLEVGRDTPKRELLRLWLGAIWLTWLSHVVINIVTPYLFGVSKGNMLLINYVSPTILLGAVTLLLLFAKLKFSAVMKKLIAFFAPLAFGVYLIHVEPLIWSHLMLGRFRPLADLPLLLLIPVILLAAFGLWLVCSCLDYLRLLLFRLLRIAKLSAWLDDMLCRLGQKLLDRFPPKNQADE